LLHHPLTKKIILKDKKVFFLFRIVSKINMGSVKCVKKQPAKKPANQQSAKTSKEEGQGKDLWASKKHDAPRAFRNMMIWKGLKGSILLIKYR
jgi:hypothetical protein